MVDKLTVAEAAEALGISRDAVYKRIERNKIRHERDADGQLYVYVEESETRQRQGVESESSELISEMRARIELLERQLEQANERDRENRRLLAAALERIPPQLEAGEAHEPPPETEERVGPPRPATGGAQEGAQRLWWRRLFGG